MIRDDCRHFKGETPCAFRCLCEDCPHYAPFGPKILLIKRAAMGDVLRTTALLPGLKRQYPGASVFWVVDEESLDLLKNNPMIFRTIPFTPPALLPLLAMEFEAVICLDKDPAATAVATKVAARSRFGFGLNPHGNLMVFNAASDYAYRLGIDDELKFFKNRKTYQEIIYETAEIAPQDDPYVFVLTDDDRRKARAFFARRRRSGRPAVGLNTGAGSRFETKQWPPAYFRRLIRLLTTKLQADVFLLGGEKERAMNRSMMRGAAKNVFNTGNDHSLLEFAGFIEAMDIVVSSDSLGMHLAIGLGKKVIALFGPTCPQEISVYNRGAKLFAGIACSPCYKSACPDMICMEAITPEQVLAEIRKVL
jgi:ADP-heptose:LPS heptosyltransferase